MYKLIYRRPKGNQKKGYMQTWNQTVQPHSQIQLQALFLYQRKIWVQLDSSSFSPPAATSMQARQSQGQKLSVLRIPVPDK